MLLEITNDGPLILSSNFWDEDRGKYYVSVNAGCFRMLLPPSLESIIPELKTARVVVVSGELSPRTWADYYRVAEVMARHFGKLRPIEKLTPADFDAFRADLAKTRGPVAMGGRRKPVPNRTGRSIKSLSKANLNMTRQRMMALPKKAIRKAANEAGSRMFEAEQLRAILKAAGAQLRAMVLLGLNCAFGQTDVANLPRSAVDLKAGWITYPRPKTEIARRCPLWPETVQALREATAARPEALDPLDAGLVFITQRGARWVRGVHHGKRTVFTDGIAQEFRKVLIRLVLKGRGSFYNLRHVFRTIADNCRDEVAIDAIMGHVRDGMGDLYRERIDDGRLQAVVDHVRAWLWPAGPGKKKGKK